MARPWPDPPPGYVSLQQAAARLGVSDNTVRKWTGGQWSGGRFYPPTLFSTRWRGRVVLADADVEAFASTPAALAARERQRKRKAS